MIVHLLWECKYWRTCICIIYSPDFILAWYCIGCHFLWIVYFVFQCGYIIFECCILVSAQLGKSIFIAEHLYIYLWFSWAHEHLFYHPFSSLSFHHFIGKCTNYFMTISVNQFNFSQALFTLYYKMLVWSHHVQCLSLFLTILLHLIQIYP